MSGSVWSALDFADVMGMENVPRDSVRVSIEFLVSYTTVIGRIAALPNPGDNNEITERRDRREFSTKQPSEYSYSYTRASWRGNRLVRKYP